MHNPVLAYAAIAVLVVFATAAIGGVLDPTAGVDRPDWWPGLLFIVAPLVLGVRGLMTGIIVRDTDVVVRGWLRTRHLPRQDVLGVNTRRYSGVWTRGSESRFFRMLTLKTANGTIEVPAVSAPNEKAERMAMALRRALALDE